MCFIFKIQRLCSSSNVPLICKDWSNVIEFRPIIYLSSFKTSLQPHLHPPNKRLLLQPSFLPISLICPFYLPSLALGYSNRQFVLTRVGLRFLTLLGVKCSYFFLSVSSLGPSFLTCKIGIMKVSPQRAIMRISKLIYVKNLDQFLCVTRAKQWQLLFTVCCCLGNINGVQGEGRGGEYGDCSSTMYFSLLLSHKTINNYMVFVQIWVVFLPSTQRDSPCNLEPCAWWFLCWRCSRSSGRTLK